MAAFDSVRWVHECWMDDVSPHILSRLNGYYCREARTLIPPRGPPSHAHKHAHAFEYREGGTWGGRRRWRNVQRDAACGAITKRGVPLAELTRRVPCLGVCTTYSNWYQATTFFRTLINSKRSFKIYLLNVSVCITKIYYLFLFSILIFNNNERNSKEI